MPNVGLWIIKDKRYIKNNVNQHATNNVIMLINNKRETKKKRVDKQPGQCIENLEKIDIWLYVFKSISTHKSNYSNDM